MNQYNVVTSILKNRITSKSYKKRDWFTIMTMICNRITNNSKAIFNIYLADFLKNNLTKFAVISGKRCQKAGFLNPSEAPKSYIVTSSN